MDILFPAGPATFTVRVSAVFVHDGYVLIHRSDADHLWALPGGRVQVGETTTDALRRELLEETGEPVTVGPLQWIMEDFFTYAGKRTHEIGFCYLAEFQDPARYDKSRDFRGTENGTLGLTFRWVRISEIDQVPTLVPRTLYRLLRELPSGFKHLVCDEAPKEAPADAP